jgi:predicted sulfurtransferase
MGESAGKKEAKKEKKVKKDKEGSDLLEGAVLENAQPIVHLPIPPAPEGLPADACSLVLFYQYVEPPWTPAQHRHALRFVQELGRQHGVTGRGRCAMEGLNCTCTGPAEGLRAFCQGLRDWNKLFMECDFKFTDGLDAKKKFKALTIRKVDELVAYGLEGSYAPSLKRNAATNLNADEYHKMMADPDAVIIDVRNVYESAIGHFQPPESGAELIIPPVRHSFEFPKWFQSEEAKQKMAGKKVMMYCTGGIRCERATALMDQIEKADEAGFSTKGIYHCRGGIERYMKTFPEGGFWKGRNYLFDRRLEQVPEKKSEEQLDKEVESVCCVCKKPWAIYRGAKACCVEDCKIPVIVCTDCQEADPKLMKCPLCESGDRFKLRNMKHPTFINRENATQKRKVDPTEQRNVSKRLKHAGKDPSKRIFVGKLPLVMDATKLADILEGTVKVLRWIPDRSTGFWYGSVFAEMSTLEEAEKAVKKAEVPGGIKVGKKRIVVNFAPPHDGEEWPPADHKNLERPPIPVS